MNEKPGFRTAAMMTGLQTVLIMTDDDDGFPLEAWRPPIRIEDRFSAVLTAAAPMPPGGCARPRCLFGLHSRWLRLFGPTLTFFFFFLVVAG